MSERNQVVDIMKGIAILLVVVGHCRIPESLKTFIFSFHMPLFFIISGYFFKNRKLKDEILLNLRRLGTPYLFFSVIYLAVLLLKNFGGDYSNIITALLSCFWGSGFRVQPLFYDESLFIGPMWFIAALFFVRIFANMIYRIKNDFFKGIIIYFLAHLAIWAYPIISMPFSICPALEGLGFFFVGSLIKKYDCLKNGLGKKNYPFFLFVWVYCLLNSYMDINLSMYGGFYILDILGSIGALMSIYGLVSIFFTEVYFWKLLSFCGRYSLVILVCHALDENLFNWSFIRHSLSLINDYPIIEVFLRVSFVLICMFIVSKFRIIREKIFSIY